MPVKTLKNLVLPAPFGPMIDAMWPCSRSKSTWLSAVRPPKRLVIFRASRTTGIAVVLPARFAFELAVAAPGREDALRPEDHHQHQDQSEHHALVLRGLELRRQVGQVHTEDRHPGVAQLVDPEREALEHLEVEHGHDRRAEDRA